MLASLVGGRSLCARRDDEGKINLGLFCCLAVLLFPFEDVLNFLKEETKMAVLVDSF